MKSYTKEEERTTYSDVSSYLEQW